jgi:hypothetical protein
MPRKANYYTVETREFCKMSITETDILCLAASGGNWFRTVLIRQSRSILLRNHSQPPLVQAMKEVRDFIATLTRAAKVGKNKTVGRQYV